jgi:hypothetical protein
LLACKVRQNKDIKGLDICGVEAKLLQYADDTSGFLSDLSSAKLFLKEIASFGELSGLTLNKDKTEAMWIGSSANNPSKPLGISWPDDPIRVLGVYFSYNENECNKANFENRIKKCMQTINLWQSRNLMLGRVQIIKTFLISQFLYTTSSIQMPTYIMQKINAMVFKFIWKNKQDRIKRSVMHTIIDKGGLKVPDIKEMINTSRIMWLKRYMSDHTHLWKKMFTGYMKSIHLNPTIMLLSDFESLNVNTHKGLPTFYIDALNLWNEAVTTPDSKTQFVWYNKRLQIDGKGVFYEKFYDAGMYYITDLFNVDGKLHPFLYWKDRGLNSTHYMKWAGIVTAAKKIALVDATHVEGKHVRPDPLMIKVYGQCVNQMHSSHVYSKLIEKKYGQAVNAPKVSKYTANTNLEGCYGIPYISIIDTKTREFQYKFLQDVLVNNFWLRKWNLRENDNCTFL